MDLVMGAPSRGDTVVGSDVWLGYRAVVMPGVSIGHGAVDPARVLRVRYSDDDVASLLRSAWWDWPVSLVTEHARTIMAGTPLELEAVARENGLLV
jgi:virginiamycin A acetyltransferase